MNEWLLIIAFVIAMAVLQFLLSRVKQPALTYIRVISSILLLVLAWGFAEQDKWAAKLMMTAVALLSVTKALKEYRKSVANNGAGQQG